MPDRGRQQERRSIRGRMIAHKRPAVHRRTAILRQRRCEGSRYWIYRFNRHVLRHVDKQHDLL